MAAFHSPNSFIHDDPSGARVASLMVWASAWAAGASPSSARPLNATATAKDRITRVSFRDGLPRTDGSEQILGLGQIAGGPAVRQLVGQALLRPHRGGG